MFKRIFLFIFAFSLCTNIFAQSSDNGQINYGHKIGHFAIGFGVAWGCGLANHHKTGLAIGIGLGLAKEYVDNKGGETWVSQRRDIIITSAGALLGYAIAKHYYPEGLDFNAHGDLSYNTLYQRDQYEIKERDQFRSMLSEDERKLYLNPEVK